MASIFDPIIQNTIPQNQFSAVQPGITTQNFQPGISQSLGNFNQNYQNQNALAGQLQNQALGAGPNPAQNMLNQQTASNIQQGTGMIASQKGINPELAGRMAAQQTGNLNQQAAGQAATLGAQQQLGAQNSLSSLYGQQGNQQNTLQNTLQNAQSAQNNAQVAGTSNMNTVNASGAAQNAQNNANTAGGFLNSIGSGIASLFYQGGMVPKGYADGGAVTSNWGFGAPQTDNQSPMSIAGQYLNQSNIMKNSGPMSFGGGSKMPTGPNTEMDGPMSMAGGAGDAAGAGGGLGDLAIMAAARGGQIPGKAPVKGNSPKNDVVPAVLSPGEVVIPRSVMGSANAPQDAAKFVAAILARKGLKKGLAS
jgi:hypothetical protein